MTRDMIDCTHDGFPAALPEILTMAAGDVVALYDTGSPDIAATSADVREIPSRLHVVMIDQGFTGSPNPSATIRDCENGAWSLGAATHTANWHVDRPTLYLGYPDTAQMAYNAGWRYDVWLVHPSDMPPTSPPVVPPGLNVVAVQWGFSEFDRSVVFDPTWPLKGGDPVGNPVPPTTVPSVHLQPDWRWCHKCQTLFYGPGMAQSVCPAGGQHNGDGSYQYPLVGIS